jgi:hypothetical protein
MGSVEQMALVAKGSLVLTECDDDIPAVIAVHCKAAARPAVTCLRV